MAANSKFIIFFWLPAITCPPDRNYLSITQELQIRDCQAYQPVPLFHKSYKIHKLCWSFAGCEERLQSQGQSLKSGAGFLQKLKHTKHGESLPIRHCRHTLDQLWWLPKGLHLQSRLCPDSVQPPGRESCNPGGQGSTGILFQVPKDYRNRSWYGSNAEIGIMRSNHSWNCGCRATAICQC